MIEKINKNNIKMQNISIKVRNKINVILAAATAVSLLLSSCGPLPAAGKKDPVQSGAVLQEDGMNEELTSEGYVSGDPDSKKAFIIWSWDSALKDIMENIYGNLHPEDIKRMVFVNTGDESAYTEKLDRILRDPENSLYPDMFCVTTEMAGKYTENSKVTDISELGISGSYDEDMYGYLKSLGSSKDGDMKMLFWNAEPGGMQIRADLAERYLGTDDPVELHDKYFSSWKKLKKTAKLVAERSDGVCRMFGGSEDIFSMLSSTRTESWTSGSLEADEEYDIFAVSAGAAGIRNTTGPAASAVAAERSADSKQLSEEGKKVTEEDPYSASSEPAGEIHDDIVTGTPAGGRTGEGIKIVTDSRMKRYIKLTKKFSKDRMSFGAQKGTDRWYSYMSGDGIKTNAVLCVPGSPQTVRWLLDADTWTDNTVLVKGPEEYFEKSEGFAFTSECSDKGIAGRIAEMFFGDEDSEEDIVSFTGRFYNNTDLSDDEKKVIDASPFISPESGQSVSAFFGRRAGEIKDPVKSPLDAELNTIFMKETAKAVEKKISAERAEKRFMKKAERLIASSG